MSNNGLIILILLKHLKTIFGNIMSEQHDLDKLDDLPVQDSNSSPMEKKVIERFFPSTERSLTKTHVLICATLAFILVGNPYLDYFLQKISYLDNALNSFGIRVVLFVITMWLLLMSKANS